MSKIQVKSIHFPFSESNDVNTKIQFSSFDAANTHLRGIKKPDLGYYKTDFVVEYEDGYKYKGRYDIGSDMPDLQSHIRRFCEIYGLVKKPNHFTPENWEFFKREYATSGAWCKEFLEKYSLD